MLMIRVMRDKYGERNYIVFKQDEGIRNPVDVLTHNQLEQLRAMIDSEERLMDEFVLKHVKVKS